MLNRSAAFSDHPGLRLTALARNLISRILLRVSFVRMVRTEENIAQEHALFSEQCLHLLWIFSTSSIPQRPLCNNRLIRNHDPKSSGLVDLPDRIDRTVFQNEVILSCILVPLYWLIVPSRSIKIQRCLFFRHLSAITPRAISASVALHGQPYQHPSHTRGAIAVDRLSRVQHSFDHIVLQIPFHRLRHVIADLLFKHKILR